jgi:hypothetical protein
MRTGKRTFEGGTVLPATILALLMILYGITTESAYVQEVLLSGLALLAGLLFLGYPFTIAPEGVNISCEEKEFSFLPGRKLGLFVLPLLLSLLTFASCSKEDGNSDNNNNNLQEQVQANVQSGVWRITKFIDSGENETSDFSGYNFTFQSSGVLTASNGSNNYVGTWSITDDNSSDDDSEDDLDFNINFNLTNNFEDLNDDWDFISQTSRKIELIDVSGGGGGTDYLTFEKN